MPEEILANRNVLNLACEILPRVVGKVRSREVSCCGVQKHLTGVVIPDTTRVKHSINRGFSWARVSLEQQRRDKWKLPESRSMK